MTLDPSNGGGSGLQRRRPGALPRLEQQELPQALSAVGGTVHHRGGAPTGRLQAQDHRWWSLHQCLEHRAAMSFLPLINTHFSCQLRYQTNQTFSDTRPQQWQEVGPHSGANKSVPIW